MGWASDPYYWLIFAALLINSIHPAVLLAQSNGKWNRRAVSFFDAAFNLLYGFVCECYPY